jgi:hypothetical protein
MDCRRERRGILFAIHGLPLKVWLGHGRRLQPAATMPPYYVPEKFAKLFAFHGEACSLIAIQIDPSPKSSVFPLVGGDLPTITIVAMPLRLAGRLEAGPSSLY